MNQLILSRENQLEIIKEFIRCFDEFQKYNPRDAWARGALLTSQRFMILIFGKTKFEYMSFEISRQWAAPGGIHWNYEAILDADDPSKPIKEVRKEFEQTMKNIERVIQAD